MSAGADRPIETPSPGRGPAWLADVTRLDLAVYEAIAATPTPTLDRAMNRLTRAANHSKLSLAAAAVMAGVGGRPGRRAAATGLASLAATSAVVNLGVKLAARRRRPHGEVPLARQVPMPTSRSFPSGHSAAAFAFATGVADVSPAAAIPLRALAAVVAYSRVHTGVHFPGDVIAGALTGVTVGELTSQGIRRTWA